MYIEIHTQFIRSRSISTDTIRSWSVGKINHVAIAVPDLEKATSLYRDILGANVSESTVSRREIREGKREREQYFGKEYERRKEAN